MAERNDKGPTDSSVSEREDGALGFPVPKRTVLPVATEVVQAGAVGEDAVKAAEALVKASEAEGQDGASEAPTGRRKAAGA